MFKLNKYKWGNNKTHEKKYWAKRRKKNPPGKYKHTNNVHVVKLGVDCANYYEKVPTRGQSERGKKNEAKRRKFLPLRAIVSARASVFARASTHICVQIDRFEKYGMGNKARIDRDVLRARSHTHYKGTASQQHACTRTAQQHIHTYRAIDLVEVRRSMCKRNARSSGKITYSRLCSILSIWVQLQKVFKFHSILNAALSCAWCLEAAPLQ